MEITLIRHGRVKYKYKKFYSSEGFNIGVRGYDYAGVDIPRNHKYEKPVNTLYVSGLMRTHETAKKILPEMQYIENQVFNEVAVTAFANFSFKLPYRLLVTIGRGLWLFNSKNQPETRKSTENRAKKAINILEKAKSPVVLISHGVFMRVLVRELRKKGYKLNSKVRYKNLDEIVLQKK